MRRRVEGLLEKGKLERSLGSLADFRLRILKQAATVIAYHWRKFYQRKLSTPAPIPVLEASQTSAAPSDSPKSPRKADESFPSPDNSCKRSLRPHRS